MGQSQPSGHQSSKADAESQHQKQPHQPEQHPTSAAFARVADFTDSSGKRLLTEAGFVELFASCQLPQRLIRAAWLTAARPGREFLTAEDLAEFHNRLEAATTAAATGRSSSAGDAQRMLLLKLLSLVDSNDDEFAAADSVLETAWLSRGDASVPDCLRSAMAQLLKPPAPPPAETDDADEDFDASAELARLVGRHLPQLLSEPTSALLVCLRSPASLAASIPSPSPSAGVLEPWLAWILACQLPPVFLAGFPTAQLLYDTDRELRSPSQLTQLAFDYDGPTLLLAEAADGRQFCFAADRGFREAWQAYGEADCRLTQTAPELRVLLSGSGLVYANLKASVGTRGVAMGRGGSPVVLIGPELDTLSVFGVPDKLARLRAIGLGDPGLVERLREERERDRRLAAAARDRKLRLVQEGTAGWEKNVDRQLLEWGGAKNAGNNAQAIEGREAELGTGRGSSDEGPARLLKPEF
ncbi:hypothetical protein BOX15_Mlig008933g3 [Macrostomum lignano]|uniref:TLDc domain-containing protein n=1 Tax=Macrostomum lignano TaxID=282301 RepID=A0A267GR84_9PLAT|nr:hypothetical protein BOX15_Mlig008933g3 [Macrostomum lignano]